MSTTGSMSTATFQSSAFLLGLCGVGWVGVAWSTANMGNPVVQLMMPRSSSWTLLEAMVVFVMWSVMMGAMMVPSALPMIIAHRRLCGQMPRARHAAFVAAYVLVWSGFSLLAATLQWWLQELGLLSRMLVLTHPKVASLILIGIGAYQFTPIKEACLGSCRTPLGFLATEWRDRPLGAFIMGLRHGVSCVGCCWALMLALFVFGAMELTVIALLSTAVALEKLTHFGQFFFQMFGMA